MQLRVLALAARNELTRSEHGHHAPGANFLQRSGSRTSGPATSTDRWRCRCSASYDAARSSLLTRHSDLSIAQAQIAGANYNLRLQSVCRFPNVDVYGAVQRDYTSPLDDVTFNLQFGIPVPLFNRNQGNISSAQAELAAAQNHLNSTRNV